MKYLVMECHSAYAVVLDQQGRFLQCANMNYQVGQTLTEIMVLQEVENREKKTAYRRWLPTLVAAACLCLMMLGCWRFIFSSYGVVHMQVNPSVAISVNRLGYVLDIRGENADGEALLAGYDPARKKVDQVLGQLADRAYDMGYLKSDSRIRLEVQSSHESWAQSTQARLAEGLQDHVLGRYEWIEDAPPPTNPVVEDPNRGEVTNLPVWDDWDDLWEPFDDGDDHDDHDHKDHPRDDD